jgi:predicted phosphodiesterase
MRVAVVSDIHGNRHAFEAVLREIDRTPVDAVWCLGDLVGYGADPDACCALAEGACDLCLVGNHDLAVRGDLDLDDFSRGAAIAAQWTREVIGAEALDYLASLDTHDTSQAVGLYHASPRDPVWEYVVDPLGASLCLDVQPHRVCLVGHSHIALSFDRPETDVASGAHRGEGSVLDLTRNEWLLNPGSVGQPRDGDPRAAWMLLDTGAWSAEYRRTEYDVAGAAAAIRAARLPDSLAERLRYGQ